MCTGSGPRPKGRLLGMERDTCLSTGGAVMARDCHARGARGRPTRTNHVGGSPAESERWVDPSSLEARIGARKRAPDRETEPA